MNLLSTISKKEDDKFINIYNFRQQQYNLIKYFMEHIVNYLSQHGNNYLKLHRISVEKKSDYISIFSNYLTEVKVEILNNLKNDDEPKTLFKVLLPSLIDGQFFVLNGNYYVPALYVVDKPIIMKNRSIKLTSLFNSISIYNKFVTFMGINIPAFHFISTIFDEQNSEDNEYIDSFCKLMKVNKTSYNTTEFVKYLSNKLNCEEDKELVLEKINKIFFDDYTKILYNYCHDIPEEDLSIKTILKKAIEQRETFIEKDFINLKYKRIIFLEALLTSIFKRIASYLPQILKELYVDEIRIDQMEVIKFFRSELHNRFIYDNVNCYSGMLIYKACMLNPGSENAPSVIADIHETHFQNICPISISNQRPGETVYLTPNVKLDHLGQIVQM